MKCFISELKKLDDSGNFVFTEKNFDYGKDGLTGRYAAEEFRNHGINADNLTNRFFHSLKKPLGEYLADKKIRKIKKSANLAS